MCRGCRLQKEAGSHGRRCRRLPRPLPREPHRRRRRQGAQQGGAGAPALRLGGRHTPRARWQGIRPQPRSVFACCRRRAGSAGAGSLPDDPRWKGCSCGQWKKRQGGAQRRTWHRTAPARAAQDSELGDLGGAQAFQGTAGRHAQGCSRGWRRWPRSPGDTAASGAGRAEEWPQSYVEGGQSPFPFHRQAAHWRPSPPCASVGRQSVIHLAAPVRCALCTMQSSAQCVRCISCHP